MPREKELFRDNLVRLDEAFPDHEMISLQEIMAFTGMTYKMVRKYLLHEGIYVSKAKLASKLS